MSFFLLKSGGDLNQQVLHGAIQVAGNKSVIFSFEIRYMNESMKDREKNKNIRVHA